MTPFERKLQRQSFRPLPAEWRDLVLAEPKNLEDSRTSSGWRDWLWPSPLAWAAIAAVWLVAFSADAIDRRLSGRPTSQFVELDREPHWEADRSDHIFLFTWQERDRLLANLN